MIIKQISTAIVEVPTQRPHKLSLVTFKKISYVIVRILTDQGIEGLGEAAILGGPAWSEESLESVKSMIDIYLSPILLKENPMDIERLRAKMDLHYRGNYFAKAAVEMALFDIVGKAYDLPAYQLLGGFVRDKIQLSWTLAINDADKEIAEAEYMMEKTGHFMFKYKVGSLPLEKDVERVQKMRKAHGMNVNLRIDANQGWNRSMGTKAVRAFEEFNLDFIEQPVPKWDFDGLAAISRTSATPIMADESNSLVSDAIQLLKREAASVFSLKVTKAGGLLSSKTIAGMVEWAGYECYIGCMIETGIGTAAYLALGVSSPAVTMGCELFGPLFIVEDIVNEPTEYKDGHILINKRPGLGVTINEKAFNKYLIGSVTHNK